MIFIVKNTITGSIAMFYYSTLGLTYKGTYSLLCLLLFYFLFFTYLNVFLSRLVLRERFLGRLLFFT
jgi:hypothetical protein